MLVILIKITDQIGILFEQNWTTSIYNIYVDAKK